MNTAFKIVEHCLRVKIKSLASESRIIRDEMERCKKSRGWDSRHYDHLRDHRRGVVRREARKALLALAAIRGTPYLKVESRVRKENELGSVFQNSSFKDIHDQIKGMIPWYCSSSDRAELLKSVNDWINDNFNVDAVAMRRSKHVA